jgi:hypothetical protein
MGEAKRRKTARSAQAEAIKATHERLFAEFDESRVEAILAGFRSAMSQETTVADLSMVAAAMIAAALEQVGEPERPPMIAGIASIVQTLLAMSRADAGCVVGSR